MADESQAPMYDAIVIGGGPAGLTAGMYLARARYRTLVLEKDDFGGQATITAEIVNYPGVASTDGTTLTRTMRDQASDFGAELMRADVTGVDLDGDVKTVHTSRGDFRCFGVVLAMGAAPRRIGFEGESEYAGRVVAYCATCDGEFFTGKDVVVVGGGFAAAEEAVFLGRYARKVTVLVREDDFTCDASVADRAKADPKLAIRYATELVAVQPGPAGLVSATLRDVHDGKTYTWAPDDGGTFGVFVVAGYVPRTDLVKGKVMLNDHGYVVTGDDLRTNVDGVYAPGDLRVKDLRQVVTATADGAIAAVGVERYAAEASARTDIVPERPTGTTYQQAEAKRAVDAPADTSAAPPSTNAPSSGAPHVDSTVFSDAVVKQLDVVFARMARPVTLQLQLDRSELSAQLVAFVDELVRLSHGKLEQVTEQSPNLGENGRGAFDVKAPLPFATPMVRLLVRNADGRLEATGLAFHGVPTGHEFHSFVLGLYNAAGPGQPLSDEERTRIEAIHDPVSIMLLVSLTCTMCPETVRAAQRIASLNPTVRAEAYDIAHFPALKEEYDVMSVPCIVIDRDGERKVEFGKKTVSQLLDILEGM
ncbi:MAG: FAD-dependent oxidoreductase [Bifidobacterium sp.]|nr:FAD-dependent oxidoreductase [Bifidobacterium sp.]